MTEVEILRDDVLKLEARLAKYESFLDLLIAKEESRAKLRNAVIEKSLLTLIGSLGTAGLLIFIEGVRQWLKRP